MITLDEYKEYLVNFYRWPMDNTEEEIEKRKIHLKQNYTDEYLEKIINDTYSFIIEVLKSDTIDYNYYRKDINDDTTKYIYLFLHGCWSSDTLYVDDDGRIISKYIMNCVFGNNFHISVEYDELEDDRDDDILSYYYRYYIYLQNFPSNVKEIKNKLLYEDAKRKYSSGSLLKKKKCNGRTIKVYPLDAITAENINRRVAASSKQNFVESNNSLVQSDDIIFGGPIKTLKLK